MKLRIKNTKINYFQDGGQMAPEDQETEIPVGAEQEVPENQGQDPMMQILQMCAQAVQTQDCQIGLQVCDILLQMAQQAAPQEQVPAEETQPIYRRGGILSRRIRK